MIQNLTTLLNDSGIEAYNDKVIKPGVICRALVPYVPQKYDLVEPPSYDPASGEDCRYKIVNRTFNEVCDTLTDKRRAPYAALGIYSDEVLVVDKTKLRPVVVLGHCIKEEQKSFPKHFKDCLICAPLYTLVYPDSTMKQDYNPETVENVVALQYRSTFPVPSGIDLDSQVSMVRFDRIMPIRETCLTKPKSRLTKKWFAFICVWLNFFATGKLSLTAPSYMEQVCEDLATTRDLLLQELNKHRKSQSHP
jgi:hypothetical protein